MAIIPTKREVKVHGNVRWMLDFGVDPVSGKRRRPAYKSEAAADEELKRIKKEAPKLGDWWTRQSQLKRQIIETTCVQIEAAGLTLAGVWADWQKWKRETPQVGVNPKPYQKVVDEWERRKPGRRQVAEIRP